MASLKTVIEDGVEVHIVRHRTGGAGSSQRQRRFADIGEAETFKRLCEVTGIDREPTPDLLASAGLGHLVGLVRQSITLKEYAEKEYLPSVEGKVSANTLKAKRANLRLYVYPELGHIPLENVTDLQLSAWQEKLIATKGIAAARNAKESTVGPIFTLACKARNGKAPLLPFNPLKGEAVSQIEYRPKRKEVLECEEEFAEYVTVVVSCGSYDGKLDREALRMAIFLGVTGLRRCEARCLDVEDLEEHWLTVRCSKTTAGRGRRVPITDFHRAILGELPESGPIFRSARGRLTNAGMSARFNRARMIATRAGQLDMAPHHWRHFYFTWVKAQDGVDLITAQQLIGHEPGSDSRVGVSGVYSHVTRALLRKVGAAISDRFSETLAIFNVPAASGSVL